MPFDDYASNDVLRAHGSAGGPLSVLIVDDSRTIRYLYRVTLEAEGFRVLVAEDGVVGLQSALVERPDVLIVDMVMPQMDGMTMITLLRQQEASRGMLRAPVIVLSGMETSRERNGELGIVATLDKAALTPKDVAQAIKTLVATMPTRTVQGAPADSAASTLLSAL